MKNKYSDEQLDRLMEMTNNGCTMMEISEKTGIPFGTVKNLQERYRDMKEWSRCLKSTFTNTKKH